MVGRGTEKGRWEDVEKLEPLGTAGGSVNPCRCHGNDVEFPQESSTEHHHMIQ